MVFTNLRIEVSATENRVTIFYDDTESGERLEWSGELHEENVEELREALRNHEHAEGGIVELKSPEDDTLRRMAENLMNVAEFFRTARRYSGR